MFTKSFTNDEPDNFSACHTAEDWLKKRGFSLGYMQGPSPRGILFGDYEIAKWRNLNGKEKKELDGQMTGSMRNGPVMIELWNCNDEPAELAAEPAPHRG